MSLMNIICIIFGVILILSGIGRGIRLTRVRFEYKIFNTNGLLYIGVGILLLCEGLK